MEHINIPAGEIHQPHNWQWADQTARLAEVVTDSFLVGRFGLQVSDGTLWRLASTSPAVWATVAHYEHPASHPPSIITQDALNRFVTDAEKLAWDAKQAALGFTPENVANRGAASGYVPLDADSKVPAAYLPSYVDDVLEFSDLAALPATGETGKIYTTLDNGKIYRWGISTYAEISPSPGSTDAVPEGVTNLYHTASRVRDVLLTGLSTATNAVISAADSVLSALGKLQKQISDLTAATITNTPAGNIAATNVQAAINELDESVAASTRFIKADPTTVAFTKLTAGTAEIKAGTLVDVDGTTVTFAAATAITMPALTAGTDYAIYACTDGTVRADASFSAPSGYTTANSRKIGGFHYAPGGNATGTSGGDTTPAINAYSLWDIKFRPACADPRGMTLVADSFWADIYLCGVDHLTNGTSKYNVTIADGASPPKVPALFGGNGSTAYTTLTWWEAGEVARSHGKRLPTYDEFAALAYGTTEATSGGTDPVSTILRAAYTSKWGVMLATGNLWQWGAEFGGGTAAAAWVVNTTGRGSTYQLENAALFGGYWVESTDSGSRCSFWGFSPTYSSDLIGSRAVADLLILE